jgi:hypothetical protein
MFSRNIKTAVIVAIVVGTILNTINSYEVILGGNFNYRNVVKIILTYITPFCVSLYSSTKAAKSFNNTNLKSNPATEK